jgi:hypothetical protein
MIVNNMDKTFESNDLELSVRHAKIFGYPPNFNINMFMHIRKNKILNILENYGNNDGPESVKLIKELNQINLKITINR